jgi:hypothetical protein
MKVRKTGSGDMVCPSNRRKCEMFPLTMDLKSSAEVLGTEPEAFLEFVERERLEGVIKLDNEWRVSIFTLARILNTTPGTLLELIEDYALGQLIEEVEDDELFEDEEGHLAGGPDSSYRELRESSVNSVASFRKGARI